MKFKLLTLNLWRYYEWDKRKDKLISFLKKQDVEFILFQEAAFDERSKYKNQVHEINTQLNYNQSEYVKLNNMNKWHNSPIDWNMNFGFGILSKSKIIKSELVLLQPVEKDKNYGFVHNLVETSSGKVDLINVHFENTNIGAKEHLKKTLDWCKKKKIYPIIAGDFNIKLIDDINELAKEYEISYNVKPYISFYPTKHSHDKQPIILDYIIAHKTKFKINKIKCFKTKISDHKPIIAEIEIFNKINKN